MKCPKCAYLGFETSDRCRNCGYDFSLTVAASASPELPLHSRNQPDGPLADFDLVADGSTRRAQGSTPGSLDLDRMIGTPTEHKEGAGIAGAAEVLPLFPAEQADDTPLITTPRTPRPPLAVRRTTPERARTRIVIPPTQPNLAITAAEAPPSRSQPSAPAAVNLDPVHAPVHEWLPATSGARLTATVVDLLLLAGVDAVVVYLTLALSGLDFQSLRALPLAPLIGFLAILDGGYLVAFIAASGQTIGKMIVGIRVMGDDGHRVDIGSATLRALGCAVSALTVGLAYLPAFVTADRRALHDRMAGTRVVKEP